MSKRKIRSKRSPRSPVAFLVSLFLSCLVGTGQGWCGSSSPAAPLSPDRSGKKDPVPVSQVYRPSGKPDPFEPFVERDISQKKMRELKKVRPLSIFPLQRAGIGEYRLIGIAGNEQGRTAIVTNVRGNFFPLFVGTVIGLNGGQVTEILEDRVIVEERVAAGKGQYKTRRIPLKLHKAD